MNIYLDDFYTAVDFLSIEALNIPNLVDIDGNLTLEMLNGTLLSLHILQLARP